MPAPSSRRALLLAAIVAAAGAACYAVTLHAPFQYDDGAQIVANPCGADLSCYVAGHANPRGRYVGYLSIGLNRRLGGLDVVGFHLFNLAVHIAASLLVLGLVATTLRAADRERRLDDREVAGASLLAALFFVAHPVQTQAVTYVVQRFTSMATLLYVATLLLHARSRLRPRFDGPAALLELGALACAVGATFTKEISFTLPLAVVAYDLAFLPRGGARRAAPLLLFLALLPIVPLTRLGGVVPASEVAVAAAEATQVQTRLGRLDYFATEWRAILGYLRLLVLPTGQSIDHEFPVSFWPWSAGTWAAGAVLAGLLALGASLLAPRRPPELRVAGYGVVLFFLALGVESTFIPIIDVFVEHRIYLPSVGAAMAVGGGGLHVWRRASAALRRPLLLLAAGWIVLLGAATVARNLVWLDPITLWSDAAAKGPGRPRAHFNLGNALRDAGDMEGARRAWTAAAEAGPWHSGAWSQLGNLAALDGDLARAERFWRRALETDPGNAAALYNLAGAVEAREGADAARPLYRRFAELPPGHLAAEAAAVRRRFGWPATGAIPP